MGMRLLCGCSMLNNRHNVRARDIDIVPTGLVAEGVTRDVAGVSVQEPVLRL